MEKLKSLQAATMITIAIFCLCITHNAIAQKDYQVGVPICDTIDTRLISHGDFGECNPYDYLWFKLDPSLIPYVSGLSFQIVIIETNGRIWSSLSDTVNVGDILPIPAQSDSGVMVFFASNSSFRFITRIVGTPMVPYEDYYCEIKQAVTARVCANTWWYFGEDQTCQVQPATSVKDQDDSSIRTDFQLLPNYPNPFNPETTIEYVLPKPSFVKLKIYDTHGQEVRTLVNEFQQHGVKSVIWDGKSNQGRSVMSGVYIYKIVADGFTQSSKSLLLK